MADLSQYTGVLDHLSFSQLRMFSECPQKWWNYKVLRLPFRPSYTLLSGSALHKGMEVNNLERMDGKEGLRPGEIVEVAIVEMETTENIAEMVDKDGTPLDLGKAKDRLTKEIEPPVRWYKDELEPGMEDQGPIVGVEQKLDYEIDGVPFVGYIDLVREGCFYDYKLESRRKAAHAVRFDPQMRLYEAQLHKPSAFVEIPRAGKSADVTPVPKDPRALAGVLDWARSVVNAIKISLKTGSIPRCKPGEWRCGPKTCEFFSLCYPRPLPE